MSRPNLLCAVALLLTLTGSALAQNAEQLAKAMAAGQPGENHKRLEPLTGDWDVKVRFNMGGQWHAGTATCHAKWILAGRFVEQRYESELDGAPFVVLQLLGYDNRKEQFLEVHMDNMDTGIQFNQGSLADDQQSITFPGQALDAMTGAPAAMRIVYTFIDKDHFRIEWFQKTGDAEEQPTVVLEHTRK